MYKIWSADTAFLLGWAGIQERNFFIHLRAALDEQHSRHLLRHNKKTVPGIYPDTFIYGKKAHKMVSKVIEESVKNCNALTLILSSWSWEKTHDCVICCFIRSRSFSKLKPGGTSTHLSIFFRYCKTVVYVHFLTTCIMHYRPLIIFILIKMANFILI